MTKDISAADKRSIAAALIHRPDLDCCLVVRLTSGVWTLPSVVTNLGFPPDSLLPELRRHLAEDVQIHVARFEAFSTSLGPFEPECASCATFLARHKGGEPRPDRKQYAEHRWLPISEWNTLEFLGSVGEAIRQFGEARLQSRTA